MKKDLFIEKYRSHFRSFLVFTLDRYQEFSKLIGTVDQVLHTHRYPGYYENPCFHVSFAYSTAVNREEKLPKDWQEKVQVNQSKFSFGLHCYFRGLLNNINVNQVH